MQYNFNLLKCTNEYATHVALLICKLMMPRHAASKDENILKKSKVFRIVGFTRVKSDKSTRKQDSKDSNRKCEFFLTFYTAG